MLLSKNMLEIFDDPLAQQAKRIRTAAGAETPAALSFDACPPGRGGCRSVTSLVDISSSGAMPWDLRIVFAFAVLPVLIRETTLRSSFVGSGLSLFCCADVRESKRGERAALGARRKRTIVSSVMAWYVCAAGKSLAASCHALII
jgi:hypothetical protein